MFLNQPEACVAGEAMGRQVVRIAKQETQGLDGSNTDTRANANGLYRAFQKRVGLKKVSVCVTPPGPLLMLCSTCFSRHRMCLCASCEVKDVFRAYSTCQNDRKIAMCDG